MDFDAAQDEKRKQKNLKEEERYLKTSKGGICKE